MQLYNHVSLFLLRESDRTKGIELEPIKITIESNSATSEMRLVHLAQVSVSPFALVDCFAPSKTEPTVADTFKCGITLAGSLYRDER